MLQTRSRARRHGGSPLDEPRDLVFRDGTVSRAGDTGRQVGSDVAHEHGNTPWLPLLEAGAGRAVFRVQQANSRGSTRQPLSSI
eukprot:312962-Pyramimonas_sp.AAC.1